MKISREAIEKRKRVNENRRKRQLKWLYRKDNAMRYFLSTRLVA